METFDALDRCAAFVAARDVLEALRGMAPAWPTGLAQRARSAATDAVVMTATSLGYGVASAARRRHVRAAIAAAVDLAATCEVAGALGEEVDELVRQAGR